jgi:hypothetical protein
MLGSSSPTFHFSAISAVPHVGTGERMGISSPDKRYRLCPECGAWFKPSKYCGSYAREISKYCGPDCRRDAVCRRSKEAWQRKQRKAHDSAAAEMRGIGEERGTAAPVTANPSGPERPADLGPIPSQTAETTKTAPVLAGDRHREAVRNCNREALQRFEQQIRSVK